MQRAFLQCVCKHVLLEMMSSSTRIVTLLTHERLLSWMYEHVPLEVACCCARVCNWKVFLIYGRKCAYSGYQRLCRRSYIVCNWKAFLPLGEHVLFEATGWYAGEFTLCASESFSPEWVHMCFLRSPAVVHEYMHCLQMKCFSPEWVSILCWVAVVQEYLHCLQAKGFSPSFIPPPLSSPETVLPPLFTILEAQFGMYWAIAGAFSSTLLGSFGFFTAMGPEICSSILAQSWLQTL